MKIELERVYPDSITPVKGSTSAACYDLHAYLQNGCKVIYPDGEVQEYEPDYAVDIPAGGRMLVPTGWKMRCPEGYSIDFLPRSGLSFKEGVSVVNTPGVIDCDYSDQCYVALINHTNNSVVITHGQRIAQMRLSPVIPTELEEVTKLSSVVSNRNGGFGSSGKQ